MSEFGGNGMHSDDDFYGEQDVNIDEEVARQKREVEALRRQHFNTGLREGASDARDATLQGGFDKGFVDGAKATSEAGFILGACSVLDALYTKNESNMAALYQEKPEGREGALQTDVSKVRESTTYLREWLRAPAIESTPDVQELRRICETAVSLEIPDYPTPEATEEPNGDTA